MGEPLADFLELIQKPDSDWDLLELALQISRLSRPDCPLEPYRQQIERLGKRVRERGPGAEDPYGCIESLNTVLFQEEGFRGNVEDYYYAGNSFLVEVLESRKGIPITLSILYREVALRTGLSLECVAMPGHFLLKYRTPLRDLFIDAFHHGEILLEEECRKRMEKLYPGVEFRKEFLAGVSPKVVILRLLTNLKQIYQRPGQERQLLAVLDRRIPLLDHPLPEVLERGLVKLHLEDHRGAFEDLSHFVQHTADERMRRLIGKQLERVRLLAEGN